MESRPIPIEDLKSGEFYDIQSSDENPSFLGALLLEHLPNNQAKLMLLSPSNFDRSSRREDCQLVFGWGALQVTIMRLHTVYQYQSFTHLSYKILKWPEDYESEELIDQIKKEMRKAVSEDCWVFNLPHFCGGYLHVYLSYLRWSVNCTNRMELFDLLFEFMDSFFSVLRAHICRIKLLSEEHIRELLKAMKDMDQIPEMALEISKERANPQYIEKSLEIAERKKSYFDSYRPIEWASKRFDRLWELIAQEYHQDLIIWQLQEPLSPRSLLLHPTKLIGILSCYPEYARDIIDLSFPGLQSEEILRLKSTIEATVDSFRLAENLAEHLGIAAEELSRIILENGLVRPILIGRSEKLQDFLMTRVELFPSVFAYLQSASQENIQINKLLKCVAVRIAVEDWQFISFLIEHRNLNSVRLKRQMSTEETINQITELARVSVEHQMSAELLRDLLPCVDYGHLIFPALVTQFHLPHCREVMITYFRPEHWHTDVNNALGKDRLLSFFRCLTTHITLKDWKFVNFIIQNYNLRPATQAYLLNNQEMYDQVKELIRVSLEHQMSADLIKSLLPCVDYGHMVFPAFAERFHLPGGRAMMITYFRPEQWHTDINNPNAKDRLLSFWKCVTARIALEDWEFVTFLIQSVLIPTTKESILDDQEVYEGLKTLVGGSLKYQISAELLRDLLPCVDYGHFVFPILVETLTFPKCREIAINYFRPEIWHPDTNLLKAKDRLLNVWMRLFLQMLKKPESFYTLPDQKWDESFYEIVDVALDYNICAELLTSIFPCVDYGHLVFPALAAKCHHARCIEVMNKYFRPEEWHFDISNPKAKKRLYNFLDCLVTRITLGDLDFIRFVTDNDIIVPGMQNSSLESEVRNHMIRLISLLFTRQIKVDLFRSVFPCVHYGDLVFPALVERFESPECREIMSIYFRLEEWHRNFNNPKAKDRLLSFWKGLSNRIELEDWEFVTFVIKASLIPPIEQFFFDTPLIYQNLKPIFHSAIEHRMNPDLLQQLFPCENYGDLAFPAFLKASFGSRIREMMISYYGSESRCVAIVQEMLSINFRSEKKPPQSAGQRKLRNSRKHIIKRSKDLTEYLKGEKRNLWYVFGALVRIQFIWMRQFSPINRLGSGLVREICCYLA